MSLRLNFNASAIRSQLSLQSADRLLARSTERLSSGIRLNRSADDPAGLTIANALRYQLRGMSTATDNVENGINMISSAEGAMDELSMLLNRMRGLAVNAANEGANDAAQLQALQGDLQASLNSIDRIADNTQFGSQPLLNGALAGNTFDRTTLDGQNLRAVDYYQSLSQDYRQLPNGIIAGTTIAVDPPSGDLQRSSLNVSFDGAPVSENTLIQGLSQNGTILSNAAGESITIEGPEGAQTIAISGDTTIGKVRDLINGNTGVTGLRANYDEASGSFAIESATFGAVDITVTSSNDMSGGSNVGLFDSDTTDADTNSFVSVAANQTVDITYEDRLGTQVVTLTQDPEIAGGRGFSNNAFTLIMRDTSDGAFGSAIEVPDITYTAQRKAPDRIMLGPQEGQHARLEIPDMHSKVLGQNNGTGIANLFALGSGNALTSGNATQAIEVIDQAIEQVNSVRGNLGALQASSLESTASFLRISSENLSASEGRIRDVDFAQESAQFAKQQTLLQAATAMLAQANQVPSRVVQLLNQ